MPTTLSLFSWTDEQPEGFDETTLAHRSATPFDEIDLSDTEAQQLMTYIKHSLENNEHVTLRLITGD